MSLEDPEDLAPGDALDLGDAVRITKNDTNLRRTQPLSRKLADVVLHLGKRSRATTGFRRRSQ